MLRARAMVFSALRAGGRVWFIWLIVAILSLAAPGQAAETGPPAEATPTNPPPSLLDLSFKELLKIPIPKVYGASKMEQDITQAPAAVTVIKADEIKKYGYRTLADLLQSVRGLYVTYDRNYAFLGTRGFNSGLDNSRVLLLVNGHRLNNNLTDGAAIGTDFILDVDLIDQVEIIRGAGSVLYGNNAFFSVINVRTRRPVGQEGVGGEVSGEMASYDTYKGRVTYGNKFKNDLELLLSASLYDTQGRKDLFFKQYNFPASHNGIVSRGDDDDSKSFFGTLGYHDFTLQGAFITREKGNPTSPDYPLGAPLVDPAHPAGTAFNDPRTRTIDERSYVELQFDHPFSPDSELKAKIYYDRDSLDRGFLYNFPPVVLNKEIRAGEWWGAEVQVNKRLWDKHTFTLGAEYRDDFRQSRLNYDDAPHVVYADVHRARKNGGIFFQSDLTIVTNLHFNAGVRYDKYGDFDGTANPRLALIYNPWEKTAVKAIYGTAFRAPNFVEEGFVFPKDPLLVPETITTYELVYEQGLGDHLRSSVGGFYNQMDGLISFVPGIQGYRNLAGAEAKGAEMELEAFWSSGWRGRLSYTFQDTKDRTTGHRLTDSPQQLAKVNLSAPLYKEKLFAGLEFQYTTARTTLLGTEAAGFGLVNFTLFSQNLVKNLEASVSLYNLLDRKYGDPATPGHLQDVLEQDGRSVRVKLTYRF